VEEEDGERDRTHLLPPPPLVFQLLAHTPLALTARRRRRCRRRTVPLEFDDPVLQPRELVLVLGSDLVGGRLVLPLRAR